MPIDPTDLMEIIGIHFSWLILIQKHTEINSKWVSSSNSPDSILDGDT